MEAYRDIWARSTNFEQGRHTLGVSVEVLVELNGSLFGAHVMSQMCTLP